MRGKEYRLWERLPDGAGTEPPAPVRVAILALPQASMTNIAAFHEDLQAVNMLPPGPAYLRRFRPRIVAETTEPRHTISGLTLCPHAAIDEQTYEAVVVPTLYDDGCLSDPDYGPILTMKERDWLRRQHAGGALIATMCSGAYALAETGLLDGHESAMHPIYVGAFQKRFDKIRVMGNRTLLVSGTRRELVTGGQSFYTADVSLFVIAHFHGASLALDFATLYGKTWSEAMHEATLEMAGRQESDDEVVRLAQRFFLLHLTDPGLVGAAADKANLTVRTLSRRFVKATGMSPRAYITGLRIERAMRLLGGSRMPIDDVAARVGYVDRSSFAKAFRARAGLPPAEYRARFLAPTGFAVRTSCEGTP